MIPPEHQQSRQSRQSAAQPDHPRADADRLRREHHAHAVSICRRSERMRKPRVLRHRKRRNRQPRKRTLKHKRQRPDRADTRRKPYARAERKVRDKIAAQADDRKRAAVRILENSELFLPVAIAGQRIGCIRIAIQMNAARHRDGNQAESRRLRHFRQGQQPADTPQCADNRADQRERRHRIAHISFIPLDFRHRQRGKHGKRHANRFKRDQIHFPLS